MTAKTLKTISVGEALEVLNAYGMSIGRKKLCAAIQQNAVPFGTYIAMDQDEYIVYPALLQKWITERLVTEEVQPELAAFIEITNR